MTAVRFARWVFLVSGIYGVLLLPPLYFLEERLGRDFPPPINHPEYFYGFVGVALMWQVAFLVIAGDPLRYRPLMVLAALAKFSFGIAAAALFAGGRLAAVVFGFACVDLAMGCLFLVAFWRTAGASAAPP